MSGFSGDTAGRAAVRTLRMGLAKDRIEGLRVAALLHDIGKMSVPAETLSKPTKLTEVELSLMKAHPETAYEILKRIEFPWPVVEIALWHHERLDGSGYPNVLTNGAICVEARILAVADAVETMASHRPASGVDAALGEIKDHKGKLYDADVVETCIRLFGDGFRFAASGTSPTSERSSRRSRARTTTTAWVGCGTLPSPPPPGGQAGTQRFLLRPRRLRRCYSAVCCLVSA